MSALDRLRANLPRLIPQSLYAYLRRAFAAVVTPWVYSLRTGHLRSAVTGKIVDREGRPLPWYTLSALDFLSSLNFAGRRVLEFGSGYSSLWWSQRAAEVHAFEANRAWLEQVRQWVPQNVRLHALPTNAQGLAPDLEQRLARELGDTRFDVIVIDGADRLACARATPQHLAADGVVVFDNSDAFRDEQGRSPVLELFREQGYQRVDFYGLAPGNLFPHCTSLIFRSGCFAFSGQQDTLWLKPFDRKTYELNGYSQAQECDIREVQ